jgi:hypothetical protein
MSFDIAAFIKKFAPSFTHALGIWIVGLTALATSLDSAYGGFYGRMIARMLTDMANGFGPWLSCPTRLRTSGGFPSAVADSAITLQPKQNHIVAMKPNASNPLNQSDRATVNRPPNAGAIWGPQGGVHCGLTVSVTHTDFHLTLMVFVAGRSNPLFSGRVLQQKRPQRLLRPLSI